MPIGPWHSLASVASNCPKNVTWISCSARQGPSRSGLPLDHISTQSLPALVVLLPLARAKLTSAPGPLLLLFLCLDYLSSNLGVLALPMSFCFPLACHRHRDPPQPPALIFHHITLLYLCTVSCSLEAAFSVLWLFALMFVFWNRQLSFAEPCTW